MPSGAVISARSASRAFASVILSQDFWASRFHDGQEFEHIFEVWELSKADHRDWRGLYFALKPYLHHPALENRKRLWNLLKPTVRIMQAYSGTALQGAPNYIDPSVKTGWRSVNGDFGVDSFGPSKKLYTRSVSVPTNLDFVAVSHRKYRGSTFVAGLRFMADDGHSTSLGYVLDRPHLSDFRIGSRGKGAPLEGFDPSWYTEYSSCVQL